MLPVFAIIFFVFSLDRSNISQALTDNLLEDLNIDQNISNIGVSLLWGAICIGDIPSNMILSRIGAKYWIPSQVVVWSLISTLQCLIKNKNGFLATRFLLGLAESGFIPGALAFLSNFYTKHEYAKRVVFFFYGDAFASMFGPLVAAGILKLRGHAGLEGWRWLWLIEGLITFVIGVFAYFVIPRSVSDSKTLIFGDILDEYEAKVFESQLILADKSYEKGNNPITSSTVFDALIDWRIYPHIFMAIVGLTALQPTMTYGSYILKEVGFNTISSNLLAIPWTAGSILSTLGLATLSDRYKDRSGFMLIASLWYLITALLIRILNSRLSAWRFYALYSVYQMAPSWHNINVAWITSNQSSSERKSVILAFYFMAANFAGIPGNQIFREGDKPKYLKGWVAVLVLYVVLNCLIIGQRLQYSWTNGKKKEMLNSLSESEYEEYKNKESIHDNRRLTFVHPI